MEEAIYLSSKEMVILEQNSNIIAMDKKFQTVMNTKNILPF
jgi:hypothetical protein